MTTGNATDLVTMFDSFSATRSEKDPAWLIDLRRKAIDAAKSLGMPDTRHEDWKWTSLKPLNDLNLTHATTSSSVDERALATHAFEGLDVTRVVLVDGRFAPELSSAGTDGLRVTAISDASVSVREHLGRVAPCETRYFAALNTAFMADGVAIQIDRDARVERPVQVVSVTTGEALTHPRVLFVAEPGSRATVIETHAAAGVDGYASTPVTEIVCGEGADVRHLRVQNQSKGAVHLGTLGVRQESRSRFSSTAVDLGARLARNELHLTFAGDHGFCDVGSLYAGRETQIVDNHTRLHHKMPHCESHQLFKGILDGRSRGIFDGKIHVYQDAQKTDAKQTARNLLLSDDAISNNKPQLEIYADDVKCTHGATTGQIDDDQLFYLRARGLDADTSRSLLTYAFGREVIDRIEIEPVRRLVDREVLERLPMGSLVGDAL